MSKRKNRQGRSDLKDWHDDIETAKQLCYPISVVEKLVQESNPNVRSRILRDARHMAISRDEQ